MYIYIYTCTYIYICIRRWYKSKGVLEKVARVTAIEMSSFLTTRNHQPSQRDQTVWFIYLDVYVPSLDSGER